MADLSTVSATDPADSEVVSQGASRIRTLTDATKTSFDVEHDLTGPHTFKSGNAGARPAAGYAGRLYLNTTDKRLERDGGAAWQLMNVVPLYKSYTAATQALTLSTYVTVASVSVDIPSNGRVLCLGQGIFGAPPSSSLYRFRVNGTVITADVHWIETSALNILCYDVETSPATGAVTVDWQISAGTTPLDIAERLLTVLIV